MRKYALSLTLFLCIFSTTPSIIRANQIIYSEDFSDPTALEQWTRVQNDGANRWSGCLDTAQPTDWQIQNGMAGIILDGTSCITVITPSSLSLETVSAYQIEFDLLLSESIDMDRNLLFLWQDKNNWYDIKLYGTGVHLEKVIDGVVQAVPDSQVTYPFQANQTYHFTIYYRAGQKVLVKIDDHIVIDTIDQIPFIEGFKTVGLKTALGGGRRSVSWYDNIVITALDISKTSADETFFLPITLYRQNDPFWGQLEYDTATQWSRGSPTIQRWGCALSSMVMILNYYQITHFADGKEIDPATLNEWLITQPDGYIGEGLVNWLAITRLTREISTHAGTPKLEYMYHSGSAYLPIIDQLKLSQPAILNIEGHFLVSHGFILDQSDLLIADPFYPYTHLSQHESPLLSSRFFTPSYTDLSYLLVITEPSVTFSLTDEDNQPVTIQLVTESLTSADENRENQETTTMMIYQFAKPSSGLYTLHFNETALQSTQFQILSYDQMGSVTIHTKSTSPQQTITYTLSYQKEETTQPSSTLQQTTNWNTLMKLVHKLFVEQKIEEYIHVYITKISTWAQNTIYANQLRYVQLLHNYIEKSVIDSFVQERLLSELNSL